MAHIDVKTSYALQLTPEEFRLVGLALAGKLKPGAETKEAAELNARLQELRLKQVALSHEACEAALQKGRKWKGRRRDEGPWLPVQVLVFLILFPIVLAMPPVAFAIFSFASGQDTS